MIFGNPAAFWLLLIIFLIAIVGFWGWKVKKEMAKVWLNERKIQNSQIKKYALAIVMATIVILAISSPKISFTPPENTEKEGLVVFMVDVSGSMAAKKDLDSPSRLERIKPMLLEIIDEFPSATFYPFHFTSVARSITPPLTKEDFPYLKRSIVRILDINSAPGNDSSLRESISQVVNKISKEEKTKIIVLFGDGEFFSAWSRSAEGPSLDQAVGKAVQENIKIVTVGVGEKEGAKIPLYDENGEFTGEFAKYGSEVFVSKLNEETLKLIASKTQGEYFSEEDFKGVVGFLNKNMESKTGERKNGHQDIGYLLLVPAAILWIIFARIYLK